MPEPPVSTPAPPSAARSAANYAQWYVVLVAFFSILRGTASYFGGPAWIIESMPWPEVFYGPAIALGTTFGVSRLSIRVEDWLRRRRET